MAIITLLTDFGLQDWFVAVMKGVIKNINPQASCIDITHEIPPGDIRTGAFVLSVSYSYFPEGSIHLAIVDPGVGGTRSAIAVATHRYIFIGPDNGILSFALRNETIKCCYKLENPEFFLPNTSKTFHGRDIFAPVAAYLSRGVPIEKMGSEYTDFTHIPYPKLLLEHKKITGIVLYIDRFGNYITNIPAAEIDKRNGDPEICFGNRIIKLVNTFSDVEIGEPLAYIGSTGLLEIGINGGSASKILQQKLDQIVEVIWK